VLLGLLLCGGAQAADAASGAPAHGPPVPLLWKVSGHEGASLYLLGSFHLLRPDDYPLAPEVRAAFAQSSKLLFELSPEEVESPALAAMMLQAAQRRDGRQLRDDLSPRQWQALQVYAAQHGQGLDAMAGMEPWFVALQISLEEMSRQGLDPALGLDRHFMSKAEHDRKPVAGLETAAEQIRLLDGMDLEEQRQMLAEALDDARDGNRETRQLHDLWRAGDAHRLWTEMAAEMKQRYPALYRNINVDRNDRWVPQLVQRLQPGQGTTMVVVGALHLLGDDGVVEKLRARGYQVERICSACEKPAL
jgi:uncharacterized protein YbaP (TraB family)